MFTATSLRVETLQHKVIRIEGLDEITVRLTICSLSQEGHWFNEITISTSARHYIVKEVQPDNSRQTRKAGTDLESLNLNSLLFLVVLRN
jgi:hypothetical protein